MNPPASPPTTRLDIGAAVRDGWRAFRRAPWTFMAFALVLFVLLLLGNLLQNLAGTAENPSTDPVQLLLALFGAVATVLVNLWGVTGLVRGAWCALEGRAPTFATLARWDGPALARLFLPQLAVGLVGLGVLLLMGLVPAVSLTLARLGGFFVPVGAVAALSLLGALLIFLLYWVVSQFFLSQVALVEGPGPLHTLERGQRVVTPHWGSVLLLGLLELGIVMVGLAALVVGLFAAWPVVAAISTAAYRQLFGTTLHTDLLLPGEREGAVLPG